VTGDAAFIFSQSFLCYTSSGSLIITALTPTHRKSVVLLASLMLIVAQLLTLVHAAEHPFHDHEEICEILGAAEKHDTSAAAVAPAAYFAHYSDELSPGNRARPAITAVYSCPARGPPAST
jgi:hypothetical protein